MAKVTATSPHSVTYNFASGNSEEKFSINPSSGVISLLKALDREQQKGFTLVVVCTDSEGEKAKAHVNVHVTDVNDNRSDNVMCSLNKTVIARFNGGVKSQALKVVLFDATLNRLLA